MGVCKEEMESVNKACKGNGRKHLFLTEVKIPTIHIENFGLYCGVFDV